MHGVGVGVGEGMVDFLWRWSSWICMRKLCTTSCALFFPMQLAGLDIVCIGPFSCCRLPL
jgi:hypothetical protein